MAGRSEEPSLVQKSSKLTSGSFTGACDYGPDGGKEDDNEPPILPCQASQWRRQDAEDLGIYYKPESWQDIFKSVKLAVGHCSRRPGVATLEARLIQIYTSLMDMIPIYLTSRDVSEVADILITERPRAVGQRHDTTTAECEPVSSASAKSSSKMLLLERMVKNVAMACSDLKNPQILETMARETDTDSSIIEHQFIEKVHDFLEVFTQMLMKCQRGRHSREDAFKYLFQTFARIFRLNFSPGSTENFRLMKIFGKEVSCEPDLHYELLERNEKTSDVLVVTVAEVKKDVPKNMKKETSSFECPPAKKRKMDLHQNDFVFDENIKGQHAAELLAQIPYTILKSVGDDKIRVLGLVVQSTKVRLTCLEISKDHVHQLNKEKYSPLKEDMRAYVSFSKAYDMLVREDWEDLVEIMLTLGSIGDIKTKPLNTLMHNFFGSHR